jgi:hypothetical protein
VPHCSSYVWRYGAKYNGGFRRGVVACPVPVQERLRGWRCRGHSFGGRPHANSRVPLTGGRRAHSSWCGCVLSPRTPTASRMAVQCPRWRRGGGDGLTALKVTEGTRPTSRHGPVQAQSRRPSSFEGYVVLFRGRGTSAVREWAAECHGTDTGHTAQRRTVTGMASPGELAEQRRGVIPRRVVAWSRL